MMRMSLGICDWLDGDGERGRREVVAAAGALEARGNANPGEGQILAVLTTTAASLSAAVGDVDGARDLLREAHGIAVATRDRPIQAAVATAAAWLEAVEGRPASAAALLGAGEVLRGAPDATGAVVAPLRRRLAAELSERGLEEALAVGRADDAEGAAARLAAASGAASVGAQR